MRFRFLKTLLFVSVLSSPLVSLAQNTDAERISAAQDWQEFAFRSQRYNIISRHNDEYASMDLARREGTFEGDVSFIWVSPNDPKVKVQSFQLPEEIIKRYQFSGSLSQYGLYSYETGQYRFPVFKSQNKRSVSRIVHDLKKPRRQKWRSYLGLGLHRLLYRMVDVGLGDKLDELMKKKNKETPSLRKRASEKTKKLIAGSLNRVNFGGWVSSQLSKQRKRLLHPWVRTDEGKAVQHLMSKNSVFVKDSEKIHFNPYVYKMSDESVSHELASRAIDISVYLIRMLERVETESDESKVFGFFPKVASLALEREIPESERSNEDLESKSEDSENRKDTRSVLVRSMRPLGVQFRPGYELIPVHALLSREFKGENQTWITRQWIPKYAQFVFESLFDYGIAPSSHTANLTAYWNPKTGDVASIVYHDFIDIVYHPLALEAQGKQIPDEILNYARAFMYQSRQTPGPDAHEFEQTEDFSRFMAIYGFQSIISMVLDGREQYLFSKEFLKHFVSRVKDRIEFKPEELSKFYQMIDSINPDLQKSNLEGELYAIYMRFMKALDQKLVQIVKKTFEHEWAHYRQDILLGVFIEHYDTRKVTLFLETGVELEKLVDKLIYGFDGERVYAFHPKHKIVAMTTRLSEERREEVKQTHIDFKALKKQFGKLTDHPKPSQATEVFYRGAFKQLALASNQIVYRQRNGRLGGSSSNVFLYPVGDTLGVFHPKSRDLVAVMPTPIIQALVESGIEDGKNGFKAVGKRGVSIYAKDIFVSDSEADTLPDAEPESCEMTWAKEKLN